VFRRKSTYDLLNNAQCDAECNNDFCVSYHYGSSFVAPNVRSLTANVSGTPTELTVAADFYRCPYSGPSNEHPLCEDAAAESVYLDDNVAEESYSLCHWTWIGDGICDDSCRRSECGDDGGDCDEGSGCTAGGFCSAMFSRWRMFSGDGSKLKHSTVCEEVWGALDIATPNTTNCSHFVEEHDYNGDGMTNFREILPIGALAVVFKFEVDVKGPQINCSQCIAPDLYHE